jgi:hypothetical protein
VAVFSLCWAARRIPAIALPKEFESDVGGVPTDSASAAVNGVEETEEEEEEVEGGEVGELAWEEAAVTGLDLELGTRVRGDEADSPLGIFGALVLNPVTPYFAMCDICTGDT